MAYLLIIDR